MTEGVARERMGRILVTGGTGVLGRQVVQRLSQKADVRVLSHAARPDPGVVRGDLETGAGLAAACQGVDVVVHCAGIHDYLRAGRDVRATRRLLEAIAGTPHIVFISVVGADRVSFGYHRAKLATEQLLWASGLPVTILRTTLFHDLVLRYLKLAARGPVAIAPRGGRAQPVDSGEVADRLAELALGAPAGRVADMGGPRVHTARELMRTYLAAVGSRKPIWPLPKLLAAGFRGDQQVVPEGTHGIVDFASYLRARTGPDGEVRSPYEPGVSRLGPR
jgi:uncharacterized protein YbjT (DUF2867 family)